VTAVLHPEALGHGDLHARQVVAVPDRLQHGVGEAQVQDLVQAHLAQEVVDPVELRLLQVGVDLAVEGAGGGLVVAEGLLHHHPGSLGQAGLGQALDHGPEQERRDLQVEDGGGGAVDGVGDPPEGGRVAEVPGEIGQAPGEALEDLLVNGLAGGLDRLAGVLAQVLGAPVVNRDPHHRAGEQPAALQPVEGAEGHHLGQVAADPEHHQHVGRLVLAGAPVDGPHRLRPPRSGFRSVVVGTVGGRRRLGILPMG
jgi:hypothetical protein